MIAFFIRSQYARGEARFDVGLSDRKAFRWASAYGRGSVALEGAAIRGAAAVVNRDDFAAFMRDLLDPSVPARELLRKNCERSGLKGAIALNLGEVSATAAVAAGGGINANNPRQPLRDGPMTFGATQAPLMAQAQLGMTKRMMAMRLRLGVAGRTSVGNEWGGGYGGRADFTLAARAGLDVVKFDTDHEQNLRLAGLGLDVAGLRASMNNITEYKRTTDWVAAEPLGKTDWDDLAARAAQVPGLQVPAGLDPTHGPEARAQMQATLQQWVDRLQAMEVAVLSQRERRPELWTAYQDEQASGDRWDVQALRRDAAGVDEVKVVGMMHRAREALIRERLAERGLTMLQSSARIELNVPNTQVLTRDVTSNHGHQKLGSVIARTQAVREQIPGMKMAMKAFSQVPGYNQTRAVFNLNRRLVADLNELLLATDLGEGRQLTYRDIEAVLATTPLLYQPEALIAKNKEVDARSVGLPVGLTFRMSSELAKDRTVAELRYIHGYGDRLLAAAFLPSGQQALSQATQGLHAFARRGEHLVPPLHAGA